MSNVSLLLIVLFACAIISAIAKRIRIARRAESIFRNHPRSIGDDRDESIGSPSDTSLSDAGDASDLGAHAEPLHVHPEIHFRDYSSRIGTNSVIGRGLAGLFRVVFLSESPRERVWKTMAVALALIVLLGGRSLPEVNARENVDSNMFEELELFADCLAIVQRDYVEAVPSKKLVEGAIKGLLTTLDPHSGYLDPDFYQDLQVQTRGEFGGLGIEITIRDGLLVVVAPMEGSPAAKAGVRPGDAIIKIDGKFTKEFSLVDAVKKLRGPKGSKIAIAVSRKGHSGLMEYTLTREVIHVRSVKFRQLENGYGYIRISQFMERTGEDLKNALKTLSAASGRATLSGLILDLRNNPGGLLSQAISVSDLFLREGIIVYTDGRIESQKQKYFAKERGTEPDYPIVVLVNGGSASASEIVAGALKDAGRALILGTQTFGKGSVQTITPLENGGAVTLTTALYYTKSGRSLQALGVKPDIEVENVQDRLASPRDVTEEEVLLPTERVREGDLPGAIKNPSGESVPESPLHKINKTPKAPGLPDPVDPEKTDLQEWQNRDAQFRKALEVIKSFNVLKPKASATDEREGEKAGE